MSRFQLPAATACCRSEPGISGRSAGRLARSGWLLLALLSAGCIDSGRQIDQVVDRGELRVITRPGPTTRIDSPGGHIGIEQELVSRFARHLGVRVRWIEVTDPRRVLSMVKRGRVDLGAAGIMISEANRERLTLGPAYQSITPQLVYRYGTRPPASLDELSGRTVEVIESCPQGELLESVGRTLPDLEWREVKGVDSEELVRRVYDGEIDHAILQSNLVDLYRLYYPGLEVADLDLGPAEELAWIFSPQHDDSLLNEARFFFSWLRRSGELERIIDRYYGHDTALDYVHIRRFIKHIASRLPEFRPLFIKAAEQHQVDWRLLAAIAYQESWWDPEARSPTGVRGLMMLTRATARELGIKNRLDPYSSIEGGARYLTSLRSRIAQRIIEPDRTWLALTAYNIGMGHMEDARRLTQGAGENPDHWVDVKKHLPLLSRKKWYKRTRHGYARGKEALQYVERIRSYYDLLVRHSEGTMPRTNPMPASPDHDHESEG